MFEAEFLAQLKQWDDLGAIVGVRSTPVDGLGRITYRTFQEVVTSGPLATGTYEAIADILVRDVTFYHVNAID